MRLPKFQIDSARLWYNLLIVALFVLLYIFPKPDGAIFSAARIIIALGIVFALFYNNGITKKISPSTTLPDDNATDVLTDANLQITFNEDVKANALGGYVQIYTAADVLFDEFSVDSEVSITGSVVDITVSGEFVGETGYYVLIDDTAFQDLTVNYFGGITNKATWNFVTADVDDPIISTLDPSDDSPAVPINSDLIITFNDDVALGSGFITITNATLSSVHQLFNVETDPLITVDGIGNINFPKDDTAYKTKYNPEGGYVPSEKKQINLTDL